MKLISLSTELYASPRLKYLLDFINHHPLVQGKATFQALPLEEKQGNAIIYTAERVGEGLWLAKNRYLQPQSLDSDADFRQDWVKFTEKHRGLFNQTTLHAQNLAFKRVLSEFDVLEAIFFFISRYEEWKSFPGDEHERYPSHTNSLIGHEKLPVVDLLIYHLLQSLEVPIRKIRNGLEVSHDIDYLLKYPTFIKKVKRLGHTLLVQKQTAIFLKTLQQIIKSGSDPYWNFERLLSKQEDAEKYLFFLVGGKIDGLENHYKIEDPLVSELIKLGNERAFKMGLHPSYMASNSEDLYSREKQVFEQTIEEKAQYNRQHFLRWNFPTTPDILDQHHIKADFTLGFNDRIGFRCGTSFPYKLYNFEKEEAYRFVEHPLVIMDVALLREAGYDVNNPTTHTNAVEKAAKIYVKFKRELDLLPFGHHLSVNFHNSTFDDAVLDTGRFWDLYDKIIAR
ncbi:MAG: hypothetical protein KDC24_01465 [Saprospiraceae bacterium]|nr:hypothetical protein [Saprospiraceae bacterium]